MIKKDKHKQKTKTEDLIHTSFNIVVGSLLMAFAFVFFVEYNDIIMGGVGGTAKVITSFFPNFLSVSLIVTILMWSLFIVGWIFVGTKFALKTLPATIIYPIFIELFELIINNQSIMIHGQTIMQAMTSLNPIIIIIFGSIIYGIGAGMMFIVGASSGGFDIPAAIFNKYFGIKLDTVLFFEDFIVITLSIFSIGLQSALFGIIFTKLMTYTVSRLMVGKPNLLVTIVSKEYEKVNEMILKKIQRGVTLIPIKGGYTHEDKTQIQAVIDKQDLFLLKKQLREIDPNCFVYICGAHEVLGEGFKSVKGDGGYE